MLLSAVTPSCKLEHRPVIQCETFRLGQSPRETWLNVVHGQISINVEISTEIANKHLEMFPSIWHCCAVQVSDQRSTNKKYWFGHIGNKKKLVLNKENLRSTALVGRQETGWEGTLRTSTTHLRTVNEGEKLASAFFISLYLGASLPKKPVALGEGVGKKLNVHVHWLCITRQRWAQAKTVGKFVSKGGKE